MRKQNIMKKMVAGATAFVLLLQPVSIYARENLTEKATNVSILVQDSLDGLFQQDASEEAEIENLRYKYKFKEHKNDSMRAAVNIVIDMTVSGEKYQIVANGDVSGEELSSGDVLWMGPLTGTIEVENVEYQVLAGFTRLNKAVQVSVTIQAAEGNEEIEPVMFSFGDTVITEDIYQELMANREDKSCESDVVEREIPSTFAMVRVETSEDSTIPTTGFQLKATKTVGFSTSDISGSGQTMYVYYKSDTKRLAISLRSYCQNLANYYSWMGPATTEINSMTYTLKRGVQDKMFIGALETFDFNVRNFEKIAPIIDLFADAFAYLEWSIPSSTINNLLLGLTGYITKSVDGNYAYVDVKFGAYDYANFDSASKGMPIVFQLTKNASGTQDLILETAITYRTIVQVPGETGYTIYYNGAKKAVCNLNILVN